MSEDSQQIIDQIEELDEKSEECFQKCQIRSAIRIAKETTRMAKSHSLAIHYMRGLFDQMRFGHGIMDPAALRDVSVELILILEDEEQARRIEPNLDEGHYHWLCSWMSTCAYDNLAESTGMAAGYNSEGMHACISDGLQVCRQTGKLECIKCFREYAADVYLASDDLDMVRHQCQSLLEYNKGGTDEKDRRWSGHHKLAKMHLLQGRVDAALEELEKGMALSQAEDVYLKLRAKLLVAISLDEAKILAGQTRFDWDALESEIPEQGEWLHFELQKDCVDALAAVVAGDYQAGIDLLTNWDRRLTEMNCLKDWFEVRLRLIAAYLLNNDRRRAEALAKGLEAQASESQDFLTLRRLETLLDETQPVSPMAALQTSASSITDSTDSDESADSDSGALQEEEDDETPLGETLAGYMQRIMESHDDDEVRLPILNDIMSHTSDNIEDAQDAAYLVHISQFVVRGTDEAKQVWPWALAMINRFSDNALVMSVVAALGHYFRTADEKAFKEIDSEQLEKWFKLSTTPQVTRARNFARAGSYFLDEGNIGEAERCFSRAFRLDRTDPSIVLPLAELYQHSDRTRDAQAVLDLSLREGCEDQTVAWEAAMSALQLEQFDALLTYMDKFLELGEPQTWAHYYRALACLQLGKHEESLEELKLEATLDPPGKLHLQIIELCNLIELDRDYGDLFDEFLTAPLKSVDYLSMHGLVRLLGQLWWTVKEWPSDQPQKGQLELQLLQAGLLPDGYFEERRTSSGAPEEVFFYRVHMRQPLDENWTDSPGCLYGQEEWTEYECDWGVLAGSEEQAINLVLEYQTQCHSLPAEVLDVVDDETEYRDNPGVIWQGTHWVPSDDEDDEFDLLGDDEEE